MVILSASGFRGIVGYDLDLVKLASISRAFGRFIEGGSCAVGRDTRPSSIIVSNVVIAGLMGTGCDVLDLGTVSTPAVFKEVTRRGLKGGLIATASHNPPEWNGLKFVFKGRGVFERELSSLLSMGSSSYSASMKVGNYSKICSIYPEDLTSYVGRGSCEGIKVSLDLGGGVGSLFVPKVFRWLGCKVTTINDAFGIFSRAIDPVTDSLNDLSENVVTNGCDVGFAYDSDADRVVMVDEKGRKLSGDFTLMICLKYFMEKRRMKEIVVSIDTSMGVEQIIEDIGGKVFYAKVGEANVVEEMMKRRCRVGGEGSSGGLILADFVRCRDGVLASALISNIVKKGGQLSDLIKDLPSHHQIRKKIHCSKEEGKKIIDRLLQEIPNADTMDGIKFNPTEDTWVLVRRSRTEDVLRISVEARSKDEAEEMMDRYLKRIEVLRDAFERRAE
ncbi:MAG: phosphomannomutase [archaeon]|nr:phosphomannomutase [archaeon]